MKSFKTYITETHKPLRGRFDIDTERGRLEYYLKKPIEDGMLVHLSGLGKFHKGNDPLADIVPERKGTYTLHPDKWESTFHSLTNKDLKKIVHYKPTLIKAPTDMIVADMAIANKFYRTDNPEEQDKFAKEYKDSIGNDVMSMKMPEVIISMNKSLTVEESMKWVGVDFDATLSHYTEYKGKGVFGEPIPKMVDRIKKWLDNGENVKIFTARCDDPDEIPAIQDWLEQKAGLPRLEVTNVKDGYMTELWDDRAVQVKKNKGEPVEESMKSMFGTTAAAALLALSPAATQAEPSQQSTTQQSNKIQTGSDTRITTRTYLTQNLLNELKELEGTLNYQKKLGHFKNNKFYPYKDSLNNPTIGYGHLILPREDFSNGITEEVADRWLIKDAQIAIDDANKLISNIPVTPVAAHIIANMAFQMGYGKVLGFKEMWKALKVQDYNTASREMLDSDWKTQTPDRAKKLAKRMKQQGLPNN